MTRCRNRAAARQCSSELCIALTLQRFSGGYCSGVPPLPIPNREVKPACADGTAMQCGRVGGRLLYIKCEALSQQWLRASFIFDPYFDWVLVDIESTGSLTPVNLFFDLCRTTRWHKSKNGLNGLRYWFPPRSQPVSSVVFVIPVTRKQVRWAL